MTWNHFIWIVRLLFWIGLVMWFLSSWRSEGNRRKAQIRNDGRIEFGPNRRALWGSLLIAAYLGYAAMAYLIKQGYGKPLDLLISGCIGLVSLSLIFSLPGTIIITADGVDQIFWLRKNKHIRWTDIVEINTGRKSYLVTITGTDRTKIVHSRELADRQQLLTEIKAHCGENLPPDFPREPLPR